MAWGGLVGYSPTNSTPTVRADLSTYSVDNPTRRLAGRAAKLIRTPLLLPFAGPGGAPQDQPSAAANSSTDFATRRRDSASLSSTSVSSVGTSDARRSATSPSIRPS